MTDKTISVPRKWILKFSLESHVDPDEVDYEDDAEMFAEFLQTAFKTNDVSLKVEHE